MAIKVKKISEFNEINGDNIVDFIGAIFREKGDESYLGEAVSMSQHMLQSAKLAEDEGAGEALIVAALLHDIGHYTNDFPDDALANNINNFHDEAGANILSTFFPPIVTEAVRWHVEAKRYLCAVDPEYFGHLSEASVHTLKLQGGEMSEEEIADFERNPELDSIIRVRKWDDRGKDPLTITPDFNYYAPLIKRVLIS